MNAIDQFASLLTLTREPFPASTKGAIAGSRPDLRVPVRGRIYYIPFASTVLLSLLVWLLGKVL
jgi:hypothetical protein